VTRDDDERWMRAALSLGRRGLGNVWPNPAVGAVVVRDGRVVGRGWTLPGGRPHAEAVALRAAGPRAKGATAYVTLEPCAHHGRTPPCADALAAAGIVRVVTALGDPDPRVSGRGHARLREAGIEVRTGVLASEAARDQWGFLSRIRRGRPMVTLKLATSLDGRIALASGESRWITGPEARRRVHLLRAMHDAVMVGGGTARADDPSLTVRGLGIDRQPVRVVLSSRLDLPLDGQLAATARDVPVWLVHGPSATPAVRAAWEGLGATCIEVPELPGRGLSPDAAMAALGKAGMTRVLCEGGGGLAASLLGAGLVDRLVTFSAGIVIGGDGRPATGPLGLDRLAEAPAFELASAEVVGKDVMTVWQSPRPPLD